MAWSQFGQDPFIVKEIFFALSDKVRIQILKFLTQVPETDTTTIAKVISKATNTTLYHLNILKKSKLIESKVKQKKDRQISFWSLKQKEISISVDIKDLPEHSLDTYILRIILSCKNKHLTLNSNFKQNINLEELATELGLNLELTQIILEKIDFNSVLDRIYRKIYGDLLRHRKNQIDFKLSPNKIQSEWKLNKDNALNIFYRLLKTGKFDIDDNNQICTL